MFIQIRVHNVILKKPPKVSLITVAKLSPRKTLCNRKPETFHLQTLRNFHEDFVRNCETFFFPPRAFSLRVVAGVDEN